MKKRKDNGNGDCISSGKGTRPMFMGYGDKTKLTLDLPSYFISL